MFGASKEFNEKAPIEQAILYLRPYRKLSITRYHCIKDNLHQKLRDIGIGNFSEDDIQLIIEESKKD